MNPAEFEHIARSEDQMWWFVGMRKILEAWLTRLPGQRFDRVLEAGCGTGYMSGWLSRRYGWRMFPVDLSFKGLCFARDMGLKRLAQADIACLPYGDRQFDAVVSLDVLAHLDRGGEAAALKEFLRVLRPGGKLIVRTSALDSLRSRHTEFAHERQRFTARRLRQAVESAGFQVLELSYANSLLLPVAWFKFRVWEALTTLTPQSGVEVPGAILNRLLQIPLGLEALWLRWGGRFPLGQSLLVIAEKSTKAP